MMRILAPGTSGIRWQLRNPKKRIPIRFVIDKFNSLRVEDRELNRGNSNRIIKWSKPIQGLIKANVDAAVRKNSGTGFCAIYRDHDGEVLAAASLFVETLYDPHVAETLALHWAMETARFLLQKLVQYETDCKRLVDAWTDGRVLQKDYFTRIFEWQTSGTSFSKSKQSQPYALQGPRGKLYTVANI
ncbi:hypothetical protein JHK85_040493 [Glycine max]|nr:hypothetical protein JHK85_040493 [Glycine max]